MASAYNRLGRMSAEGGLQPKEYLAKYAADRVRTTSSMARLHDGLRRVPRPQVRSFSAKDFYAMKAFFADIKETGLVPDRARGVGHEVVAPDR